MVQPLRHVDADDLKLHDRLKVLHCGARTLTCMAASRARGKQRLPPAAISPSPNAALIERVKTHMASGVELDLSEGRSINWSDMDRWTDDRTISGETIAQLLTDPDFKRNPRGIRLRGARITGGINLSYRKLDACLHLVSCDITDEINLIQTELPLLMLRGCRIDRLTADRMKVSGGVFFDYDPKSHYRGCHARGLIRMMAAEVGWLSFEGAKLTYRGRSIEQTQGEYDSKASNRPDDLACLRADGMTVKERLVLVGISASGEIRFPRSKVGALILDESVPKGPRNLVVSDMRYTELLGGPRTSVRQGLRWLDRQTDQSLSAQPYWMLASFYESIGDDGLGRFVRFWSALRRVFPRVPQGTLWRKSRVVAGNVSRVFTPRFWYGALTGFGYYALLSLAWLCIAVAATSSICHEYASDFAPNRATPIGTPQKSTGAFIPSSARCTTAYPCFSPDRYAVDSVVPFISIGQEDYWRPSETLMPRDARVALVGLKIFGWLTATLAVAGITGLLRKT